MPKGPVNTCLEIRFLAISIVGTLIVGIVCTFAPVFAQIAVLGGYISILAGLLFSFLARESQREQQINLIYDHLGFSRKFARQSMVFDKYEQIVSGISSGSYQKVNR
jgi:hypothetical protein